MVRIVSSPLLLLWLLFHWKSAESFVVRSPATTTLQGGISSSSSSSSSLHAVALPPALPWIAAHVVGGASGTPVVIKATRKEDGWYRKIPLPSFTPPDALFGPVWTTLYALMGLAVARIHQISTTTAATSKIKSWALVSWAIHILLNLSWAPIFFGLKRLRLGLLLNVALWISLVGVVLPTFYTLNPFSAYLLLPYLTWLSFATVLNQAICKLNPSDADGYNSAKFQAQLAQLQQLAKNYAGV